MKYYMTILTILGILVSNSISATTCDDHDHGHNEEPKKPVVSQCEDDHDHDDHDDQEDEEGSAITLTPQQIAETGITIAAAGPGKIDIFKSFPAVITLDQDTIAHIVPKVAGVVTEIKVSLGSKVQAGQVMAVIESRELADIKAEYMQALDNSKLTAGVFEQEENLWKDKITSKQDYLKAKSDYEQARIQLRNSEQKLKAMGFDSDYIKSLPEQSDELITKYQIKAPLAGFVIDRQVVLGQFADEGSDIFVIADTSKVWADINIYPAYIDSVKISQQVVVDMGSGTQANGTIFYISPLVSEQSKTVLARAVIDNADGKFRPGLFAKANIAIVAINAAVAVPLDAVVNFDSEKCVFILDEDGFEPRIVTTGQSNNTLVEITSGLEAGSRYVTKGAFELKSKIITSTLDPHAGHGH